MIATATSGLVDGVARLLRGEPVLWSALDVAEEEFLAFCREQDMDGLAHRVIAGQDPAWPSGITAELDHRVRASAGAELVRGRETTRVLNALAAAGVSALVYKGTALAHTAYPRPWLRPRNDTDVLVRPTDAQAARTALEAMGYIATNYCDGEELFRQYELQREDEFGLIHALDIHWGVSTQAVFADLFDISELEAAAVAIPPLGPHGRTVGPAHALLLACVHPAMHHRNEERLIWVYDVHLLSGRLSESAWDQFADSAIGKSIARICLEGLRRSTARLGTAVPSRVLRRLEEAAARPEPSAAYLETGRRWSDEVTSSLRHLGWRGRLRLLREVAFPAPRYMLAAYGVAHARMAPALLPALYAHRGLRGIWKVLTGRK